MSSQTKFVYFASTLLSLYAWELNKKHSKSITTKKLIPNIWPLLICIFSLLLIPKNKSSICLLPAKDIATSYLLALAFDPNKNLSENYKNMSKLFKTIVSGKIAKSVKEISYKKVNVKVGDYIGIFNDNITISSKNISFIIKHLVDKLFDNIRKPKNIVVIYGSNASLSDIKDIEKYIYEEYGKKPIMISGQQSIYYFYVAISR